MSQLTKDAEKIEEAIKLLESDIQDLRTWLPAWETSSVNFSGSKKFKEMAKRIVLAAKRIEALINEHSFSR